MLTEAPFQIDSHIDVKAVEGDEGDIHIEGWAARWEPDEQDEAFEPGAFKSAIDDFMSRDRPLLYHHGGLALGQVEQLEERPEGLWMKARLDRPEPQTEAADIFNKVKRGTIQGLSVAGKFYRKANAKAQAGVEAQTKIWKARLREISVTPIPVNALTLATVSQKAFEDDEVVRAQVEHSATSAQLEQAVSAYGSAIRRLEDAYAARASAQKRSDDAALADGVV